MIRVEFTISRRHLFFLVGILVVGALAVPGVSWAAGRFDDVPDNNVFAADIEWLADAGITKGCNPPANTEFCPGSYVTREQMAAFMHRLAGGDDRTVDGRLDALEDLLAGVSRNGDTLLFDGMNLQIVNGMGKTDSKNTLGNLIIGYNESPGGATVYRGGSHNLVVGDEHQYRSWGGIVAGRGNTVSGSWASVTGGSWNTASGGAASVTGGTGNIASNDHSSVTGGLDNTASGGAASVTGGRNNTASGSYASVTGGYHSIASGAWSAVASGFHNTASGDYSSVAGGYFNEANGDDEVVVGGDNVTCGIPGDAGVCGEGYWYATD